MRAMRSNLLKAMHLMDAVVKRERKKRDLMVRVLDL